MNNKYPVVVVGSGFGGIVAASEIAAGGVPVLVIDENLHIGGQLLRTVDQRLGVDLSLHPDQIKKIGLQFVQKLKEQKIEVWNNARVLGIYSEREILVERADQKTVSLSPQFLVISSGARERFLPFKGWTLPGVISTGMVQVLLKSYGVLPGKNLLIGGSGLFLFAVAYECLRNNLKPQSIFELSGFFDKAKMLPVILPFPSKIIEAARFMSKIFLNRVVYRPRWKVIEARGDGCLKEVVATRVDSEGRSRNGKEKIFKADSLAIGYGFVPNLELILQAGCAVDYQPELGGWITKTGKDLETSVQGVFAAGEVCGIAGALKSINEGKICANGILYRLEKRNQIDYERKSRKLLSERRHHLEFGKMFNGLYAIPDAAYQEISDETVICRCEDVRMKDIRQIVKNGLSSFQEIKVVSRATMGNCQGRTCAPIIFDLLISMGKEKIQLQPLRTRSPVKVTRLSSLSEFCR